MERTRVAPEQRSGVVDRAPRTAGPSRRSGARAPGTDRGTATGPGGTGAGRDWVSRPVEAAFVRGWMRFEVGEDGGTTGRVELDATVTVLGTTLARLTYESDAGRAQPHPPGEAPLPYVTVDAGVATVRLDGQTAGGRWELDTGTGARPAPASSFTVPVTPAGPAGPGTAEGDGTGADGTGRVPPAVRTGGAGEGLGPGPASDAAAGPAAAEPSRRGGPGAGRDTVLDAEADVGEAGLRVVAVPAVAYTAPVATPAGEAAPGPGTGPAPEEAAVPEPTVVDTAAAEVAAGAEPAAPEGAVELPGAAAAAPEAAAEAAPPGPEVTLHIPPAPDAPSPAHQERIAGVVHGAGRAARTASSLPDAKASTATARGAVTEPPTETAARAGAALADALGTRPAPSSQILRLCEDIRRAIRSKRPVDEEHLVEADPKTMAKDAGQALGSSVEGDTAKTAGAYNGLQQQPAGTPATTPQPIARPAPGVADPGIAAPGAAPDPVPAQNVSLDADKADVDKKVADSRINRPSAEPIGQPPFSTVREGQQELGTMAANGPAEVLAKQDEALDRARTGMAELQTKALETLNSSRGGTVGDVASKQNAMVGTEQQTRESVSRQAQQIFSDAQNRVDGLLKPLTRTAMDKWAAGVERHSTEFRQALDRVAKWIAERHEGVGGALLEGLDALTGLPAWVKEAYDAAEKQFGDRVCGLLLEISADVESVIAAAKALIDDARQRLARLFADLPAELREWAATEQATFAERLNGLESKVAQTRQDFTKDITKQAVTAVAEVQREVEQLREAAGGLIGKVLKAVQQFVDDPVKAIIEGLLLLAGIPPPAFWALVEKIQQVVADIADDPVTFGNNLVAAVAQGFRLFFDHFPDHLINGFFDWLFRGLGSVGVQIPTDLSVSSLITFALQLMGLTWPRIRGIIVKHVGEKNVALVEQAWSLISALIKKGPEGLLQMLKEKLDPRAFLDRIIQAAISYITETLVKQVAMRILGMLNPAGAVLQAIMLIYKVLRWIFENAASIFRLVETVVNGAAAILAGDIGGMAKQVEAALAMLLPIVIDLLAGLVGLGDLPEKVAENIKGFQDYIFGLAETVIAWLVTKGRALLASLGLGGGEKKGGEGDEEEIGQTVVFTAGGESHRHWIRVTGAAADLMVASEPTPLETKLAAWTREAPDRFKDNEGELAKVRANIAAVRGLTQSADPEADRLAKERATTRQSAPSGEVPAQPAQALDDKALEDQQKEIARLLGELFAAFGEGRDDMQNLLVEISAQLPLFGRRFAAGVHEAWWTRQVSKPVLYVPTDGRDVQVWRPGVLGGTEEEGVGYLGSADAARLVKSYFYEADSGDGPAKQPSRKKVTTEGFYDFLFALPRTKNAYPHMVRGAFIRRIGESAAGHLRLEAEGTLPENADQHLRKEISGIGFRHSGEAGEKQYGRFDPFVGSRLHPGLWDAVRAYGPGDPGAVVAFFEALVERGTAGGLTWDQFRTLWNTGGASRGWIKTQFRAAAPGQHEWIPVNRIGDVLEHAVELARQGDVLRGLHWIRSMHILRTPTNWVVYSFVPEGAGAGYEPKKEPKTPSEVRVHSGGGSVVGEPKRPAGTVGQAAFHDALRERARVAFGDRHSPREFVAALRAALRSHFVWDGSGIPPERLNEPIGIAIRVTGRGRVENLMYGDLAEIQRAVIQEIEAFFDAITQALP
ncbi:hypothetical protein [Streptomyces sp. NPDC058326]|uniref:phage tail protein n=1 Tax=Streptomyces sp. NPDC058326 TaxID=3346447 RepID=UPI0036EEB5A0